MSKDEVDPIKMEGESILPKHFIQAGAQTHRPELPGYSKKRGSRVNL